MPPPLGVHGGLLTTSSVLSRDHDCIFEGGIDIKYCYIQSYASV